jgi:para-nitrobenzyl esterase
MFHKCSIGSERLLAVACLKKMSVTTILHRVLLAAASGVLIANAAAAQEASPGLEGTSWQLVQFRGGDGTTLTPGDRARYTLAFRAGGNLTARIDCNRARGTWKSRGAGQIELGRTMALTRAMCAPGSLHDQIVQQLGNIRSYVMRDGHLFLSLMAGGGIYEFEPLASE